MSPIALRTLPASLQLRICLAALVTLSLVALLSYSYYPNRFEEAVVESVEDRARIMSEVVSFGVGRGLVDGDFNLIQQTMEWARADANLEYVAAYDEAGRLFASHNPDGLRIPEQFGSGRSEVGKDRIVVAAPVVVDAEPLGTLTIAMSLTAAHAAVKAHRDRAAFVGIGTTVLGVGLMFLLMKNVARRLQILSNGAQRIARGDFDVPLETGAPDEIGRLNGAFISMAATLKETISALQAHGIALADAKVRAERASAAKSLFLANMSHELRTPLNAIIGYSEILAEDAEDRQDEKTIEDLKRINGAGHHLLELITSVLDLSKIEAGRLELHLEDFDPSTVVESVVATSQSLAAKRRNRLEATCAASVGTVRMDRTRLGQILFNLVSNACKFTEDGRVDVTCRREAGGEAGWLVIDVVDTGIGIEASQLGLLFGDFVQADQSSTRRFEGTGLGLAISRRLARLMGGDITVASAPGHGSTFTIRVPSTVGAETSPSHALGDCSARQSGDPEPDAEPPVPLNPTSSRFREQTMVRADHPYSPT